ATSSPGFRTTTRSAGACRPRLSCLDRDGRHLMASAISQTAQPTLALPQGTMTAPPSGVTTTINPRTRLLLEGPIAATLLRLAPPNLVVNVILIAVTASIDAHFVGRLGAPALAGV